jgi:hypothetical protein
MQAGKAEKQPPTHSTGDTAPACDLSAAKNNCHANTNENLSTAQTTGDQQVPSLKAVVNNRKGANLLSKMIYITNPPNTVLVIHMNSQLHMCWNE